MYVSQQLRWFHILLVDGDEQVHDKIQQSLDSGYRLHVVSSLEEAQRALAEMVPDIMICEVTLPQASGLDLCQYVRHAPSLCHLPIMLLTTLSTLQDKIAGFEAGADDYIVKPFDPRHLLARIRLLSRIKHLEHGKD